MVKGQPQRELRMSRMRKFVVFVALTALAVSPLSSTVLAAEDGSSASTSIGASRAVSPRPLDLTAGTSAAELSRNGELSPVLPSFAAVAGVDVAAAQRYRGRGRGGYGRGRNNAAAGAVFVGAAAAITGAALLAYANRPECDHDRYASACGYGTKVIGTSVLAGGLVGVAVGAALWR
jgi:hypothetical protein